MSKQYKRAIVIGRFQPFHNQHGELLMSAFAQADQVIVLIGGAFKPRTPKDPFTFDERAVIIHEWFQNESGIAGGLNELAVAPIRDYMYSDATWAENVQRTVASIPGFEASAEETVLVGCNKDESSFYLKMFPQWALHEEPYTEHIDATRIRDLLFEDTSMDFIRGTVPNSTWDFLKLFKASENFQYVMNERAVINKYKAAWKAAPYAPTFVTADAVVICSGHVLMIERGAAPGFGLDALPGGFLEQDERWIDGVIRELREETKLKVPDPVLRGSIRDTAIFDHPKRSARGRTITQAALIVLPDGPLPKVKGSDDARKAKWKPLGELDSSKTFEDHIDIVEYFKSQI